jgi:hypothetical protein
MVSTPIWEKKLENSKFAFGTELSKANGITGRFAFRSNETSAALAITQRIRDAMMSGCFHGRTLPPRFKPRIRHAVASVRHSEPAMSKSFRFWYHLWSECLARLGPRSAGTVSSASSVIRITGGTWIPNAQRQPRVSHRKPPNAAPQDEPRPKKMLMYD